MYEIMHSPSAAIASEQDTVLLRCIHCIPNDKSTGRPLQKIAHLVLQIETKQHLASSLNWVDCLEVWEVVV